MNKEIYLEEEPSYLKYWCGDNIPFPRNAIIETTTRCNIRCVECARPTEKEDYGDMSLETFDHLKELFPHLRNAGLFGHGETFLNKYFFDMLIRLKKNGVSTNVITNGTLLDNELAERVVKEGLNYLTFSMDGATEETFNKLRRGARFYNIIGNIKRVQTFKLKYSSQIPNLAIQFVGMQQNIHELPELVRLASSIGVSNISVVPLVEYPSVAGQSLIHNKELSMEFYGKARKEADRLGIGLSFPIWMFAQSPGENIRISPFHISNLFGLIQKALRRWKEPWVKRRVKMEMAGLFHRMRYSRRLSGKQQNILKRGKDCSDPWDFTFITWKGDVRPCCASSRIMGNINEMDFSEIWHGNNYREFRRWVKSESPPPECSNCVNTGWYFLRPLQDFIDVEYDALQHMGRQMGFGWFPPEMTFTKVRWSGKEGDMFLRNNGKGLLVLQVYSFPSEIHNLSISGAVSVNGSLIGRFKLNKAGFHVLNFQLPKVKEDVLLVKISVDKTWKPEQFLKGGDHRSLGIGLCKAELV